jgi:hypothetical protein
VRANLHGSRKITSTCRQMWCSLRCQTAPRISHHIHSLRCSPPPLASHMYTCYAAAWGGTWVRRHPQCKVGATPAGASHFLRVICKPFLAHAPCQTESSCNVQHPTALTSSFPPPPPRMQLRVLVLGYVGTRSVKWVRRITLSESDMPTNPAQASEVWHLVIRWL